MGKVRCKMKVLTDKQTQESVAAVAEYIAKKSGNQDRHEAFVKTSEKEESYPVVLFVFAEVCENSAIVIVEWNGSCGRDYPTDFSTSDSVFQFRYGSLNIEAEDRFGRRISLSITEIN